MARPDYEEDHEHTNKDWGRFILAVRNDAGDALASDGDYIPFTVDSRGRLYVKPPQSTAFGETSVAELTPIEQVQFPYNINTDIWEIRDNNGTSSVASNMANLSTGAAANQSSTILTKRPIKYSPGQGALVRFTAIYTTGVANSTQWVGIGGEGDGFFFGYNGTAFGILRRQGGKPETRKLAITTASNTGEDIVITLNDVTESVTVTAAGVDSATTRVVTANEIAAHDFSDVGEGWEVHNMGPNVFFTSYSDGAKSGTYEITTATTAAGTFSQSLAGVSSTDTQIAQTAWNRDAMDGTGGSGMTLDPTKGNVYQIQYQWLGFGQIDFYVEHDTDGGFELVHSIKYANANTVPSIDNPTLPLCATVKNTSNTSDMVVKIGSMGGFTEGKDTLTGLPHSLSVEVASIGTTETPVMTIHSHDIYKSTINRVRVKMTIASVSVEGTKPATVRIRKNSVITGPVSFSSLSSDTSTIHKDTTATGISGGVIVYSQSVEKIGHADIDLEKIGIEIAAPEFLTLSIEASLGTVDTVSTLSWQELF